MRSGKRWSACGKVVRVVVWSVWIKIKLPEATPAEAVEQAKAPITLPVRTDRAIFGVSVAAYLHRNGALQNTQSVTCVVQLSYPSRLGNWVKTHT